MVWYGTYLPTVPSLPTYLPYLHLGRGTYLFHTVSSSQNAAAAVQPTAPVTTPLPISQRYKVAPLWKRVIAEMLDFLILFALNGLVFQWIFDDLEMPHLIMPYFGYHGGSAKAHLKMSVDEGMNLSLEPMELEVGR